MSDYSYVLEEWKRENIYPYQGIPQNIIEETERQVFDVLALNIHTYLPDFNKADSKSKKLSLTLLRQAIEHGPESVRRILRDVLELPRDKQEELAALLDRTTLSSIINAAKVVGDRLDFLKGLEALPRDQLHRILAEQAWIFGEEYTMSIDEEGLTQVLKKHLELQGRQDEVALYPVLQPDGRQGRVDLMFSRLITRQGQPEEREHLVVELKRLGQRISQQVEAQVASYATAVAEDPRFRETSTRWVFWILSNEMDAVVRRKSRQAGRPHGLLYDLEDPRIRIWVKTWGELLEESRARLHFFQERLSYSATRDTGLEYVRRTHARYLPESLAKMQT